MISEADVARVALLARLSITPEETKELAGQLASVLGHFEHVSKVKTDGVEPMITPTDIEGSWREDEVKGWKSADEAMANAPEAVGNLFKVPPVVG